MTTTTTVDDFPFGPKLKPLARKVLPVSSEQQQKVELFAVAGSVLDYSGSCIVNAANVGGVTGFGVDEMVNRAGGFKMKEARRLFNGIPTGEAKSTESFDHKKVKFVIHACGPVFRDNSLANDSMEVKEEQLRLAYANSMKRASELGCEDIAFCLISAGVFRGNLSLEKVITLGIEGILKFYNDDESKKMSTTIPQVASKKKNGENDDDNDVEKSRKEEEERVTKTKESLVVPLRICLCAFLPDEQKALAKVVENI